MNDTEIPIEGQPNPKPYELYRRAGDGQPVGSLIAGYATLEEAKGHTRRRDWKYGVYFRRKMVWAFDE